MTPFKLGFLCIVLMIVIAVLEQSAVNVREKKLAEFFQTIGGIIAIVFFVAAIWAVLYYF